MKTANIGEYKVGIIVIIANYIYMFVKISNVEWCVFPSYLLGLFTIMLGKYKRRTHSSWMRTDRCSGRH